LKEAIKQLLKCLGQVYNKTNLKILLSEHNGQANSPSNSSNSRDQLAEINKKEVISILQELVEAKTNRIKLLGNSSNNKIMRSALHVKCTKFRILPRRIALAVQFLVKASPSRSSSQDTRIHLDSPFNLRLSSLGKIFLVRTLIFKQQFRMLRKIKAVVSLAQDSNNSHNNNKPIVRKTLVLALAFSSSKVL
jgi:hypothetical protein